MIQHTWGMTPKAAVRLQSQLADLVTEAPLAGPVHRIAGVDCSYIKRLDQILACAVLMETRRFEILAETQVVQSCTFPYVPGLLSFREAPAVIEAVRRLPEPPGLLLCDGQGRAHPRHLGLASHIGLWLDVATIGVAKSRLCGEYRMPGKRKGCHSRLLLHGEVVGKVVRTRTDVKPLFVSVGHLVTLRDAVRWTLRCCRGCRLPEPARHAHRKVTELRRNLLETNRTAGD